ncbi:C40 family peptidase [Oricola thermophila]|uniref:C40 family peptidase n=1 Tax=Oricola thermophila TaxID=2742145 RepID=A0A6N1VJ89_9HYPH|nr:NlpC/P60 family protein [Oricola thermophila]QKV19462.1 C40 family peptidase [Oricola thermophila]
MTLDPRLHAYRPDLADRVLEGRVLAERFVDARPAVIAVPVADLHGAPSREAGIDTQFLLGEPVRVFEVAKGWAWVQGVRDGYVGYVPGSALSFDTEPAPTHRVTALRTWLFPEPELKKPPLAALSIGAQVAIAGEEVHRGTRYAMLADGTALPAVHVAPVGKHAPDFVAVAERFLETPYLWGGASGFGVDCSGLVQLSMRMAGTEVPRDTDMQEASIGEAVEVGVGRSGLRRGDLVFWKGHVGIMVDDTRLLHANGSTMSVALEPLADAIARIEPHYGQPTSFRRP